MSQFGLNNTIAKFNRIKFELPKIVANHCVRFWIQGFRQQGFTNISFEAWKPRKGKQYGRDKTRQILVDSGALRRSVSNSVKEATWERIRFGVELPYAQYHMEGTDKMPKRKFMGQSIVLNREIKDKMYQVIGAIWRG